MAKPVVDAKQALDDIRSGMSDAALMHKYNLSPVGLQSLIGKLVELGAVRQIRAKDLLQDIRSGATNNELMAKYNLSSQALVRLFNDMAEAGISFFRSRQDDRRKKRVDVNLMLSDIRSGASETQLMEKHGLSSRGLQSTFWKIVHAGAMTWEELLGSYPDLDDSVTLHKMRQWTRSYPILSVETHEEGNPENRGKIKDVSERGIGVTGVHAEVDEHKKLVLVPDDYLDIKPFTLEVRCRWFNAAEGDRPCHAGFEITNTEGEGFRTLHELVQLMTLTFG